MRFSTGQSQFRATEVDQVIEVGSNGGYSTKVCLPGWLTLGLGLAGLGNMAWSTLGLGVADPGSLAGPGRPQGSVRWLAKHDKVGSGPDVQPSKSCQANWEPSFDSFVFSHLVGPHLLLHGKGHVHL